MNQKTVRQLKKYARENKIDFDALKQRWLETPWHLRNQFRMEVTGKLVKVTAATTKKSRTTGKAKTKKAS